MTVEALLVFLRTNQNRLIAGSVIVAAVAWLLSAGSMFLAFALIPCIVGAGVVAGASPRIDQRVEGWGDTFERFRAERAGRAGRFSRFAGVPAARVAGWMWKVTSGITDSDLRSGLRVAMLGYFVAALAGLALAAIYIAVMVAILAVILAVVGAALNSDDKSTSDRSAPAAAPKARKLFAKTGMFSEEETGRIDEEGRVFKKTGMFSEEQVGRVDDSGNFYKKTGMFSEELTHRTDADNRTFKKTGWLSEEEVGRTDKDGNVYRKTGWLSEEQVGRVKRG